MGIDLGHTGLSGCPFLHVIGSLTLCPCYLEAVVTMTFVYCLVSLTNLRVCRSGPGDLDHQSDVSTLASTFCSGFSLWDNAFAEMVVTLPRGSSPSPVEKGDGHGLLTSAVALPFGVVPLQDWWFSHPSVSLLFLSEWMITRVADSCRGLILRGSSFLRTW